VHVDKEEAQDIVDEVVTTTSKGNVHYTKSLLHETRRFYSLVFGLASPLHPDKDRSRSLQTDLGRLLAAGYINEQQYQLTRKLVRLRNSLVHNIDDQAATDELETRIKDFRDVNIHLEKIKASIDKNNSIGSSDATFSPKG